MQGTKSINRQLFKDIEDNANNQLNNLIPEVISVIKQYSPISILKRCYEEIAVCSIQRFDDENSNNPDVDMLCNAISYIQSLIYSVTPNTTQIERIDEITFQELIKNVNDIYTNTNLLLMSADMNNDININKDELKLKSRLEWTNVKGKRYRYFEKKHLNELLLPHNEIFKEIFGLSIDDFSEEIKKIEYSIIRGYFEGWEDLKEAHKEFCKNADKNPEASIEQLFAIQSKDKKIENAFNKVLGFDLFEIQKTTSLPNKFLDKLSCNVGEDETFGTGKYPYMPIKKLPTVEKPFLKYKDSYYCFEIQSLYDNIYRNIEKIILEEKPKYQDKWNKIQDKTCQNITVNLFRNILPNAKYYEKNYYLSEGKWVENDLLIVYDKVAIIIEIKGGKFKTKSPLTDYINYQYSITRLLEEPLNQACRIQKELDKDFKITFYKTNKNQNVNNEKYTLQQNNIEQIFLCSVSLENFNTIANNVHLIKEAGFEIPQDVPIWAVSIDELRVYAHLFENDITFLHFLKKRVKASNSHEIDLNDELDHLALYFEFNDYIQYTKDNMKSNKANHITFFDYTKDIDNYFLKQEEYYQNSEKLPKPKQNMPEKLRELINLIQNKEQNGSSHVVSSILDFSGNGRQILMNSINQMLSKQFATGRLQHLNIIDISVFCIQENCNIYDKELIENFVYSSMLIANQTLRYCLTIYFDSENKMYDTQIQEYHMEINDLNKKKYEKTIDMLISNRKQIFKQKKIGRNDPCPCGSGKKYKKCCLKLYE